MEKYELAFEDFRKGLRYKDIAEKHGVSLSAVKSWAARQGWKDKLQPKSKKVATEEKKLQPESETKNKAKKTENEITAYEGLSNKQRLFCNEYLLDLNATQAAIRTGYSKRTANEQGARLLAKVSVSAYIRKKLDEVEKSKIATLEEILETQTRILRREEHEYTAVTIKTRKSSYDENGKKVIMENEEVQAVPLPSKLSDVNQAAEQLSKRLLFNPLDKHKIEHDERKLALEERKIAGGDQQDNELDDWIENVVGKPNG